MPEQIDIIQTATNNASTFTVNTAVENVTMAASVSPGILSDPGGNTFFEEGENIVILSLGFKLPHNFVLGQTPAAAPVFTYPLIQLRYQKRSGGPFLALPVLASGGLFVPFENYEVALDVFADMAALGVGEDWQLGARLIGTMPEVSMVGVPAVLNTNVYSGPIFVKVLHNTTLLV